MSYRSRLSDICLRHGRSRSSHVIRSPCSRHRISSRPFYLHTISEIDTTIFLRLRVPSHLIWFQDFRQLVIMVLNNQFANRLTPVPEETFTLARTIYDVTCQHRQPRQQTISTAFLKFFLHQRSPCLLFCLIAIGQHELNATLAHHPLRCIHIHRDVMFKIILHCTRIHLIDLKTCSLRGSRMVFLSCQRIAEAYNLPIALRYLPCQFSILYLFRQVNDILQPYSIFC